MTRLEAIQASGEIMKEACADDLTREQWLLLVDRTEVLAEATEFWDLLEPILVEGSRHGWEHPRHP